MSNNIIFSVIVAVIVIGYVCYTTFKSVKTFIDYKKNLPEFLKLHKDAQLFTDTPLWWIITGGLAIFSLVMVFFIDHIETKQIFWYRTAYLAIAIVFLGLALETYVRRRVYIVEEGVYYVDKLYRYRMMAHFELRKGIVKNIRILMNDKESIELSKKMGTKIQEGHKEWKLRKKAKKK